MLNAKFNDYVDKYELDRKREEENKKRYICYAYLSQIQPERLDRDFDLLDKICDARLEELGIIGFAIALNEQFLTTKTDIDDILQNDTLTNLTESYHKELLEAIEEEREKTNHE